MPQHANERTAIANLQRYLRQLSYHEPGITPPPVDGIFERDTQTALRQFQALQALPVTGKADRRTWEELYARYRASLTEHTPHRAVVFFPISAEETTLREGDKSFAVTVLQHMLQELSERYTPLSAVTPLGEYDAATTDAVREFQKRNRLPVTGATDLSTWNTVTDQFNSLLDNRI